MAKFNATKYDPREDSSPNVDQFRTAGAPATVILDWTTVTVERRVCPCGCREELAAGSRFRMGHDARLRGKLVRAHITGTDVTIVRGQDLTVVTAVVLAGQFTTPQLNWVTSLRDAKERHESRVSSSRAKVDEANAEVLRRAQGPQVGTRKLIKVGRWGYTGELIAVYEDKGVAIFEYTAKSGEVKTVERPLEDVATLADAAEGDA